MNTYQSMINPEIEPWTFTVKLALEAHSQAEKFRRYHSSPDKAKQAYLNTLAVYAVNFYLQCRGFETNWEQSDSWNPAMQMLMDTADLVVKDCGKLECRPVLPNAEFVCIPPEVWQEIIGYVAVQLSQSLREATLLGFVKKTTKSELPLTELRSLQDLPVYLTKNRAVVNLSQWLEGIFEAGWQAVESFLDTQTTELVFRYRNRRYRRCKLIKLGNPEQAVLMIVEISELSEQDRKIRLELLPTKGQTYLPANLNLMLLNEEGEAIGNVMGGSDDSIIEWPIDGEVGDRFGVQLALGDVSVTENFII
jgi:hypothetical protein